MVSIYHVDAFAEGPLRGNPAAVVLFEAWPADELLLALAEENALSETAFLLPPRDGDYPLRWFSPVAEVPLCGHATLAAAHVLLRERAVAATESLTFATRGGRLTARIDGERIVLDLPAARLRPLSLGRELRAFLGGEVVEAFAYGDDALAVLPDEDAVRACRVPDGKVLTTLGLRGLCVSAPGREVDVVSRFFAPPLGIPEDPVTGSAHCALVPYWVPRLGRATMTARQLSVRGGALYCEWRGDRVALAGLTRLYLRGEIDPFYPLLRS